MTVKRIEHGFGRLVAVVYTSRGGENGPVTVAAFKAADSVLRGSNGGFDSHTPPPTIKSGLRSLQRVVRNGCPEDLLVVAPLQSLPDAQQQEPFGIGMQCVTNELRKALGVR